MVRNKRSSFAFVLILCLGYVPDLLAGSAGNIGTYDRRRYGSLEIDEVRRGTGNVKSIDACTVAYIRRGLAVLSKHQSGGTDYEHHRIVEE